MPAAEIMNRMQEAALAVVKHHAHRDASRQNWKRSPGRKRSTLKPRSA